MRNIITVAALTGSLVIGLAGCSAETSTSPAPTGDDAPTVEVETEPVAGCVCDVGKAGGTVWCAECGKGYIDGKEKACEGCVKAKLGGPACPT